MRNRVHESAQGEQRVTVDLFAIEVFGEKQIIHTWISCHASSRLLAKAHPLSEALDCFAAQESSRRPERSTSRFGTHGFADD